MWKNADTWVLIPEIAAVFYKIGQATEAQGITQQNFDEVLSHCSTLKIHVKVTSFWELTLLVWRLMQSLYYGNQKNCRNNMLSSLSFPGDWAQKAVAKAHAAVEEPEPAMTTLYIFMQTSIILQNKIICIFFLFPHGHACASSKLKSSFAK